jgi:hypothetical protein
MLLLLSLTGLAGSAFANACKDDIGTFCEDVKATGDRKAMLECLESNKSELSSACAEQVDKMLARSEKSGEKKSEGGVCNDAIMQYCSEARSEGRDAVLACLESNKSDLSSDCANQVEKMLAQ